MPDLPEDRPWVLLSFPPDSEDVQVTAFGVEEQNVLPLLAEVVRLGARTDRA